MLIKPHGLDQLKGPVGYGSMVGKGLAGLTGMVNYTVWYGMVWYGMVWCMVWCMVRYDGMVSWCGIMVWYHGIVHGMVYGTV